MFIIGPKGMRKAKKTKFTWLFLLVCHAREPITKTDMVKTLKN